jgi:hypothetical protein
MDWNHCVGFGKPRVSRIRLMWATCALCQHCTREPCRGTREWKRNRKNLRGLEPLAIAHPSGHVSYDLSLTSLYRRYRGEASLCRLVWVSPPSPLARGVSLGMIMDPQKDRGKQGCHLMKGLPKSGCRTVN